MKNKAKKIAKAALQYSKWMSRFICWIWATYRFAALIASAIVPDSAVALASTLYNLDWIMLVNEGTYLINSLGEKYLYSDRFIFKWLETGGFKQMMGRVSSLVSQRKDEFQDEVMEDIEEEQDDEEAIIDGDDSCG